MKPDLRNAFVGTCPVCEGTFKLVFKAGTYSMVHHGYKRPGDGMIHGDCFAVGYEPYEKSCEATKLYKDLVEASLANTRKRLAQLQSGEVTYLIEVDVYRRTTVEFVAGVTEPYKWARKVESDSTSLKYRIASQEEEIKRLAGLIFNWVLKDITVTVEAVEHMKKAERDARSAARQAIRDEKAAKGRALAEKRAQAEQERATRRAEFASKFQALADAGDRVGALALWTELGRAKNKTLCQYGDYKQLGCDAALLTLRLARTGPGMRSGFYIYGPC